MASHRWWWKNGYKISMGSIWYNLGDIMNTSLYNDECYCYEVKVKTTNVIGKSYIRFTTPNVQKYGNCIDGTVYVLAYSFEEVANIVGKESIISICKIGIGLKKRECLT